jgi:hypothetical protein
MDHSKQFSSRRCIWNSYLLVISCGGVRVVKEKFILGEHSLYIVSIGQLWQVAVE